MTTAIGTVSAREKLKARHEPYFAKLGAGRYLGFQKLTPSSLGSWIARYRDPDTGRQHKRSLGDFEGLPAHARFDAAKGEAEKWFKHLGKGGSAAANTVRTACERYVAHLRATKPATPLSAYAAARRKTNATTTVRAADDVERRFKVYVLNDARFADTDLGKLTPAMLDAWRAALVAKPTKAGGNRGERRTPSTLNRDMSSLRAALNLAYTDGLVSSDFAWRGKLRPIKAADRRRDLYLDRAQRRALIAAAQPDLKLLLQGLSLVPLRPGALAALTVADVDKRLSTLRVGKDKAGRDRKLKLPQGTAEFFLESAKGKLPAAPLLSRADGRPWDKDAWKGPIRDAATAAKLPAGTTAYTLRHSTITDLVHGGLDLLTVAQISGTSVKMIEQHYGHLQADVAATALARLAL